MKYQEKKIEEPKPSKQTSTQAIKERSTGKMGSTALKNSDPVHKVNQNAFESPLTKMGLPKQKVSEERGQNHSLSNQAELSVPAKSTPVKNVPQAADVQTNQLAQTSTETDAQEKEQEAQAEQLLEMKFGKQAVESAEEPTDSQLLQTSSDVKSA